MVDSSEAKFIYLLTRFASAGSMLSIITVSPSISSSSDISLDEQLVDALG